MESGGLLPRLAQLARLTWLARLARDGGWPRSGLGLARVGPADPTDPAGPARRRVRVEDVNCGTHDVAVMHERHANVRVLHGGPVRAVRDIHAEH